LARIPVTANLGGVVERMWGLAMFIVGLLVMNTLMTASATGVFAVSANWPSLLRGISAIAAAYSFVAGVAFIFGSLAGPALTVL
jgi:high-affinity nickel-transport protein